MEETLSVCVWERGVRASERERASDGEREREREREAREAREGSFVSINGV